MNFIPCGTRQYRTGSFVGTPGRRVAAADGEPEARRGFRPFQGRFCHAPASDVALSSVYEAQQSDRRLIARTPTELKMRIPRALKRRAPRGRARCGRKFRVPAGAIRRRGYVRPKLRGGRQPLPEGPYRCGQVLAHADRFWAIDPPVGHHAAAGVEECGAVRGAAPAGPPPVPALHAATRGRGR